MISPKAQTEHRQPKGWEHEFHEKRLSQRQGVAHPPSVGRVSVRPGCACIAWVNALDLTRRNGRGSPIGPYPMLCQQHHLPDMVGKVAEMAIERLDNHLGYGAI